MIRRACSNLLVSGALMLVAQASFAQALQEIVAVPVPSAWKLQNYVPDSVVLWYTGSPCVNGQLLLPPAAAKADRDRLYATILAAKAGNQRVFVYFVNDASTGGACQISSFGLQQQ